MLLFFSKALIGFCIYFLTSSPLAYSKPTRALHREGRQELVYLLVRVQKGPESLASSVLVTPSVQSCLLETQERHKELPLPLVLRGRVKASAWGRPWVRGGGWRLNRCLEKALPAVLIYGQGLEGQILRVLIEKGSPEEGILLKPKSGKFLE